MENKYNLLEERLNEDELKDNQKVKILERQKELLLQFLVESNKNLFNSLILKRKDITLPETLTFFRDKC